MEVGMWECKEIGWWLVGWQLRREEGVAQRSREGGGGGGDPLGGGCAAQSHGEEIIVIFLFILLVNLLSILLPFLCRRQRNLLRP